MPGWGLHASELESGAGHAGDLACAVRTIGPSEGQHEPEHVLCRVCWDYAWLEARPADYDSAFADAGLPQRGRVPIDANQLIKSYSAAALCIAIRPAVPAAEAEVTVLSFLLRAVARY